MANRPTFPRRRSTASRGAADGSNPGTCVICGTQSPWRSVEGRCRKCELDNNKKRTPMFIERDVLASTPSKSED